MARLQLNKSSLANQTKNLATYKRFLPSLDLKRQQLLAQRNKARELVRATRQKIEELELHVSDNIPMLANEDIALNGLVKLKQARIEEENIVGLHLPKLLGIDVAVMPYSLLSMPHWVDNVVAMLRDMLEMQVLLSVNQQRLNLLNDALQTVTQRVNLFEKVLIPKTQSNIKRIKIYLSDEQMASVVRSKIAKRKRQATSEPAMD